jgi:hypothetical protein
LGLFRSLFSKYKCLVNTVFGNEKYFTLVNKLKEDGVSYETVTIRNLNLNGNFGQNDSSRNDSTQYDIYVKEEDKHKAQQAIHRRL